MIYTSSVMMPILLFTLIVFFVSIILAIILRKKTKLIWIPIGMFLVMSIHLIYLMKLSYDSIRETQDVVCQAYVQGLSTEDLIKLGQSHILLGELYYREIEEKYGDFGIQNDTVPNSYINVSTNITENSSMWNIVYLDSNLKRQYFDFQYDSLRVNNQKVELVVKVKKLADNQWECLKVIDVELKNGITYIGD